MKYFREIRGGLDGSWGGAVLPQKCTSILLHDHAVKYFHAFEGGSENFLFVRRGHDFFLPSQNIPPSPP